MTTKHSSIEFVGGDNWEIAATLLDETGKAYDLTLAHTIKWCLMDGQGNRVLDSSVAGQVTITTTDAVNGKVSVLVAPTVSTTVKGGTYTDALRLTIGGETGTLLMGPVNVIGDPWAASVFAASASEHHNYPRIRAVPKRVA